MNNNKTWIERWAEDKFVIFFCGFPLKEAAVLGQIKGTETMIESLLFFWPKSNPRGQNPEQPGLWEEKW